MRAVRILIYFLKKKKINKSLNLLKFKWFLASQPHKTIQSYCLELNSRVFKVRSPVK